jgi:hypothetical protein
MLWEVPMPIDNPAPISLDDEEMRVLQDAASVIRPRDRAGFLAAVARELKKHPEHGAGLVSRVTRMVKGQFGVGASASRQAMARETD